jgi:hypothetical protein
VNSFPENPIDPVREISHIEQSFAMLGDWLNDTIIDLAEGEQTIEQLAKIVGPLLPKLDQYERSMDCLCYQAYQLVWEFLPAKDLHSNYSVIQRVRRHRELILSNGIKPLRQFFNSR